MPVCLSILMQVPLLLRMLPPKRKLGIIFARSSAFTALAREQADISDSDTARIVALEATQLPSFAPLLQPDLPLDDGQLQNDIMALAVDAAQRDPMIGRWLIQCSDLSPYSGDIAQTTRLPVWDMSLLIEHFHSACARQTYRQGADQSHF